MEHAKLVKVELEELADNPKVQEAVLKRVAVLTCGGDWTDASFDIVILPKDFDLDQACRDYREWYSEYQKDIHNMEYFDFTRWLVKNRGVTVPELDGRHNEEPEA